MTKMISVAYPYANAVFAIAKNEDLDKWLESLAQLSAMVSSLEFAAIVDNPKISNQVLVDILLEVAKLNTDSMQNFLQLLVRESRIKILPEIYLLFKEKVEAFRNSVLAIIQSAFPLNDNEKQEFATILSKKLEKAVEVEVEIVPELIGGIKVLVNDLVIDASVKGGLEKLSTQIIK